MTRASLLFFASIALLIACSSSSSTSTNGADGGTSTSSSGSSSGGGDASTTATPQAIIQVNGGAAADCATVPPLLVGEFQPPRPVKNGASEDGSTVTVSCSVVPADTGGFHLITSVSSNGTTLEVSGTVDANAATTKATMILKSSSATWTSDTCKLEATDPQMGVATGRYWGLLSCAGADSADAKTCDIFGQIRFENCFQE